MYARGSLPAHDLKKTIGTDLLQEHRLELSSSYGSPTLMIDDEMRSLQKPGWQPKTSSRLACVATL